MRHFDCDENTSEERKKAINQFPYREERVMDEATLALLAQLNSGGVKAIPPPLPAFISDPFTCYVQHIVAKTIYGKHLPSEAADEKIDSPELYNDKLFYHHAVQKANQFREEELVQRRIEMDLFLNTKNESFKDIHYKLSVHEDYPFTEDDPQLLKAIHNVYHLDSYVNAAVRACIKPKDIGDMTYVQIWRHLTTDAYHDKAVHQWQELSLIDFVDYIYRLYRTLEYMKELCKQ